jgi:hypothetical protein
MIEQVGHDRLAYVIGQRMGSHHVHGTWASLWFHYLDEKNGVIVPRDHNCLAHINHYVFVLLVILDSISKYFEFLVADREECGQMVGVIDAISEVRYSKHGRPIFASSALVGRGRQPSRC